MMSFLRHVPGQPYAPDDLDCHCQTSTDEGGKVTYIFFARRSTNKPPTLDHDTAEVSGGDCDD